MQSLPHLLSESNNGFSDPTLNDAWATLQAYMQEVAQCEVSTSGTNGNGTSSSADDDLERFLVDTNVSDYGNALCVARMYPNLFLYCDAYGWLYYNQGYWERENAEAVLDRAVVEMLRRRTLAASTPQNFETGAYIRRFCTLNRGRVEGCKALLKSIDGITASVGEFDTHKDFLNVANGVVDLRTGELRPHSPSYRFMYKTSAPYNRFADYSEWAAWVAGSMEHPADVDWLQEFMGYSITGRTREDSLLHIWGPGRSGKGTFADAVAASLGDRLAMGLSMSTLVSKHDADSQNFALAPLKPARVVVASEKDAGQRLNAAKVKNITGGDKIRCSFKGRDHFDYTPQWKIIMLTNPPIDADPADSALWSRVHSIQFSHTHEGEEDRLLRDSWQTVENQERVLAWMVAGAVRWYARGAAGLPKLQSSIKHKTERRLELDSVAKWMSERTIQQPGAKAQRTTLYQDYTKWCEDVGHMPLGNVKFGEAFKAHGFDVKVVRDGAVTYRGYDGIGLLAE